MHVAKHCDNQRKYIDTSATTTNTTASDLKEWKMMRKKGRSGGSGGYIACFEENMKD